MRALDQGGRVRDMFRQGQGDPMDGATDYSSGNQHAPLWSLHGFSNHDTTNRSALPLAPLTFSVPALGSFWDRGETPKSVDNLPVLTQYGQQTLATSSEASFAEPTFAPSTVDDARCADADEHDWLRDENVKLEQRLHEQNERLKKAEQAIRDLATWTLNDRKRLMAEVHHQRLLREDYETILQRRDEQVMYLLALHKQGKVEHPSTLVREGSILNQPVPPQIEHMVNETRQQAGLPLTDQRGAIPESPGRRPHRHAGFEAIDRHMFNEKVSEGREVDECEEEAYSPPDVGVSISITNQVDELIAEERGRMTAW